MCTEITINIDDNGVCVNTGINIQKPNTAVNAAAVAYIGCWLSPHRILFSRFFFALLLTLFLRKIVNDSLYASCSHVQRTIIVVAICKIMAFRNCFQSNLNHVEHELNVLRSHYEIRQ